MKFLPPTFLTLAAATTLLLSSGSTEARIGHHPDPRNLMDTEEEDGTQQTQLQRCNIIDAVSEKACTQQVQDPSYCGTQTTADPRVFGPSLWTFLHILSLYYDPTTKEDVATCRNFLNGLAPMIPCSHCALHYNDYLIGTKDNSKSLSKEDLWDWDADGDPCATQESLQYFFVKKHDHIGQEVNKLSPARSTRPPFEIEDLGPLYGTKFVKNAFIESNQPEVFIPILLEALNLMAMNYVQPFLGTAKPWVPPVQEDSRSGTPVSKGVSEGCTEFFTSLPEMLPIQVGNSFPSLSLSTIEQACRREEGEPSLLNLVEQIEESLNVPTLNSENRIEHYNIRHICMHNVIWKEHPMCRYVGQGQGQNEDEQCIPWKSLDDYVSTK